MNSIKATVVAQISQWFLSVLCLFLLLELTAKPGYSNFAVAEDAEYDHYLKFYQVRFGDLASQKSDVIFPLNIVKFTISGVDSRPEVENYIYSFVSVTRGDNVLFKDGCQQGPYAADHVVELDKGELKELFGRYGQGDGKCLIRKDIVQRYDIEKLHLNLTLEHPEWYKKGFDIKYGVMTDTNRNILLNEGKSVFRDSSDAEYQQGKTIVIPSTPSDREGTNLLFNFNNPTVREYAVRYCLKMLRINRNKSLFIDGVMFNFRQVKDQGGNKTFYIYDGNEAEQVRHYADQYVEILKQIKRRSGAKIILNGLFDRDSWTIAFYERICSGKNWPYFDGVMIENRFWFDDDWFLLPSWIQIDPSKYDPTDSRLLRHRGCSNVQFYLDWINKFKQNNKIILFSACAWTGRGNKADFDKNSPLVHYIWLWYHLIADDNTYFYLNPDYRERAIDYAFYKSPLGYPLGKPHKKENKWFRNYQRGTIIFDTTYGKLSGIKFEGK